MGSVTINTPILEWGVAAAPLPGQSESGDRFLVEPFEDGALVAVVDALGHGQRASRIAAETVDTMARHTRDSVTALILRCHEMLRDRHGATISLAAFDWPSHRMTWLGIGNVAGVLVPHTFQVQAPLMHLLVLGGVVGGDLPPLRPSVISLAHGDLLIVATDGIREEFADDLPRDLAPQALAEHLFAHYAKGTDDALVLVVRYCMNTNEREY